LIYHLVVSSAATLGALWFIRRAERLDMSRVMAIDIAMVALAAGFLGARLMHIFYEEPTYYLERPLRALEFWYGGFVYLGGLAGALVGTAFFCDWKRESFWSWADLAAPPAALAYALGRLGCFLNGCCYGRYCDLPWAAFSHGEFRHPTQLYAALWEGGVAYLLTRLDPRFKKPGTLVGLWFVLHGFGRLLMESLRDDPRGPLLLGQTIGVWLSLVLVAAGSALVATRLVPRLQSH